MAAAEYIDFSDWSCVSDTRGAGVRRRRWIHGSGSRSRAGAHPFSLSLPLSLPPRLPLFLLLAPDAAAPPLG